MLEDFQIRPATVADIAVVARHRASMFRDMGAVTTDLCDDLMKLTRAYLQDAVPAGEYVGWLASPNHEPERIVAGAGVQLRKVLPFPRLRPDGQPELATGRQAIVLNVYTEPACRRHGLARALMHEVLAWAQATNVESLVLHAAPDGRPLYEALGFVATNEMRFTGDLTSWVRPVEP